MILGYNSRKCHNTILWVISARWQNRKSQTSFFHRYANLTIYSPESLYKNSRIQLESHSTPGKLEAKNSCIETGKIRHFISTMSVLPLNMTLPTIKRKSPTCAFSLGREREEWTIHQCSAQGSGFCHTWLRALMRNSILWMPGDFRNKKELSSLWQHQRTCNTANRNRHNSPLGESAHPWLLPWGKKGNSGICIKYSTFSEGFLRNQFLSHMTQSTNKTGILWVPGATENKRARRLLAAPEDPQCYR